MLWPGAGEQSRPDRCCAAASCAAANLRKQNKNPQGKKQHIFALVLFKLNRCFSNIEKLIIELLRIEPEDNRLNCYAKCSQEDSTLT
jgi:hypothetical protein